MKRKLQPTRSYALALALTALFCLPVDAETWTGAGADALWTTGGNWDTAAQPVAGAAVLFDGSSALQLNNTLGAAFTINSLTLGLAQTTAVTINTVNTAQLTFNPGTILTVSAGNHKFIGSNAGPGFAPDWFNAGADGSLYTFDIAGGASFEINGKMGQTTSVRSYNKTGNGVLIISANNGGNSSWNFSGAGGGFTVSQGIVRLAGVGARGNSNNRYTVNSGAALEMQGTDVPTTGVLTLAGDGFGGSGGALRSLSGNNTLSGAGPVTLAGNSSIGVDADSTIVSKQVTGGFSLTKVGAGTLRMDAANSYSGGTTVSAGNLIANATTALGSGNLSITGGILDISASGAGNLTLGSGANFSMSSGSVNLLLGTSSDQIAGSGGGTFSITGGSLSLDVSGAGFGYGNTYSVLSGFASGSVSGLSITGYDTANYTADLAPAGLLSFTPVPEPSTLTLLALACAVAGRRIYRRRIS